MARKKRLHYKDLDAMRFLAFVPVFLYCAMYLMASEDNPFIQDMSVLMGFVKQNSMDFFFFLSAFLLTSHALRELKYHKSFGFKAFYTRRAIRILPVLIIAILFAFILHPYIVKVLAFEPITTPNIFKFFVYPPSDIPELSKEQYIYLAVIWTIYMFIQFYIFWGIILKFFLQQIKYVSIILIGIGIASRTFHVLIDTSIEFDILSAGIPIGIGGLVAHIFRNDERTIEMIKHLPKGTHLVAYLIGIASIICGYIFLGNTYAAAIVPLVTCTFFAYLVAEQTYAKESLFKLRKRRLLSRLGRISYGLIVYQSIFTVIGIIAVDSLDLNLGSIPIQFGYLIISFIITWITADVSYNIFERPFYNIRKEFKRS